MARKDAEKVWLDYVKEMAPGTNNLELYIEMFKITSDTEFEAMVERVRNEGLILPLFFENLSENAPTVEKMMAVGTSLGVKWFQRLVLTDPVTGGTYKTPVEYLVMLLPVRRQIQHLRDKISLPSTDSKRNHLTDQATGESKGASITSPELQVLADKGLVISAEEFIAGRGGNDKAYRYIIDSLNKTGSFSMDGMRDVGGRPKAQDTLKGLLLGLNFKNTP